MSGKGGTDGAPDEDGSGARLRELGRSLRAARKEENGAVPPSNPSGIGMALRLSTELVAGVIVGSLVGWALDRWLGTSPWLFILCFVLGVAGGFLNVARSAIGPGLRRNGGGPSGAS